MLFLYSFRASQGGPRRRYGRCWGFRFAGFRVRILYRLGPGGIFGNANYRFFPWVARSAHRALPRGSFPPLVDGRLSVVTVIFALPGPSQAAFGAPAAE